MESKQEKFDRMLEARLPKAVKAIELLGNLSNKSTYEWHAGQVDDMLDQLGAALDEVMDRFGVPAEAPAPAAPIEVPLKESDADTHRYEPKTALPETSWRSPAIDGVDRRDIRAALERLTADHGKADPGVTALRKIVLGWVPEGG